jgi:uncharacterized RDD family membrane protein YckC
MKAQRVFAYIIDAIFIGVISGILCTITGLNITTLWAADFGVAAFYNPVSMISLAVAVVYFLTDGLSGGSPGKKILGLAVTPVSPAKERLPMAITRALVKVISIYVIIGIILFFTSDEHSSLHDKLAGTRVQKKIAIA